MKPFLGINVSSQKNNEQVNGTEFLVAMPSAAAAQNLDLSIQRVDDTMESAKLPLGLRILQGICGIIGTLVAGGLLRGIGGTDGVTLAEAYHNAGWLFWAGGICLAVWLLLMFWGKQKARKVLDTEESAHVFNRLDGVSDSIYRELAVPDHAQDTDILMFFYKVKNGEVKPIAKGMQSTPYLNVSFRLFSDGEKLYLANLDGKYAIDKTSLQVIRKVNKKILLLGWNKEADPKKEIYKPYKLTVDDYGRVHTKAYYILEFTSDGEQWGIYFPNYELPTLEKVTGLKARE